MLWIQTNTYSRILLRVISSFAWEGVLKYYVGIFSLLGPFSFLWVWSLVLKRSLSKQNYILPTLLAPPYLFSYTILLQTLDRSSPLSPLSPGRNRLLLCSLLWISQDEGVDPTHNIKWFISTMLYYLMINQIKQSLSRKIDTTKPISDTWDSIGER